MENKGLINLNYPTRQYASKISGSIIVSIIAIALALDDSSIAFCSTNESSVGITIKASSFGTVLSQGFRDFKVIDPVYGTDSCYIFADDKYYNEGLCRFIICREIPPPPNATESEIRREDRFYEILHMNTTHSRIQSCGSNAVIFLSREKGMDYLLSVFVDNPRQVDTLLSQATNDVNNILNADAVGIPFYSFYLRDSVYSVMGGCPNLFCTHIYRIKPGNTFELLDSFMNTILFIPTKDNLQLLLETRTMDEEFCWTMRDEVIIYDVPSSTYNILESREYAFLKPQRYKSNDNMFYIKHNCDVWEVCSSVTFGEETVLYRCESPEKIERFSIWKSGKIKIYIENTETKETRKVNIPVVVTGQ